jgi:hypothetical protein
MCVRYSSAWQRGGNLAAGLGEVKVKPLLLLVPLFYKCSLAVSESSDCCLVMN